MLELVLQVMPISVLQVMPICLIILCIMIFLYDLIRKERAHRKKLNELDKLLEITGPNKQED